MEQNEMKENLEMQFVVPLFFQLSCQWVLVLMEKLAFIFNP